MLDRTVHGYKTKAAAVKHAERLSAEYQALGLTDIWEAAQKESGGWIVRKTETGQFITDRIQIISVGF